MKNLIENQIIANGYEVNFIAESHTNAGNSYYYEIGGLKCRFSDHSTTNLHRVFNEVHFSLPIQKTLGLGGVINNVENKNTYSFFLLKERLSK